MSDQVLQIPTAAAVAAQGTEHANKRDPDGQLVASSKTSAPGQSNGQEEVDIINSLLSEWRDELSGVSCPQHDTSVNLEVVDGRSLLSTEFAVGCGCLAAAIV